MGKKRNYGASEDSPEHASAHLGLRAYISRWAAFSDRCRCVAAHLNLRDEQLPHKHLIAQVLLDKNAPRIRTVLNKLGTITNEYRVFAHEVLAGPPELDVTVREAGCERRRRPSYKCFAKR